MTQASKRNGDATLVMMSCSCSNKIKFQGASATVVQEWHQVSKVGIRFLGDSLPGVTLAMILAAVSRLSFLSFSMSVSPPAPPRAFQKFRKSLQIFKGAAYSLNNFLRKCLRQQELFSCCIQQKLRRNERQSYPRKVCISLRFKLGQLLWQVDI